MNVTAFLRLLTASAIILLAVALYHCVRYAVAVQTHAVAYADGAA